MYRPNPRLSCTLLPQYLSVRSPLLPVVRHEQQLYRDGGDGMDNIYLVPDFLALPQTPQILSAYAYAALEVLQRRHCQLRISLARRRALTMTVLPLSCGVRSTSFLPKSGWPLGSGSSSATSSAAPAIFLSSRALSNAFLHTEQDHSARSCSRVSSTYVSMASPLPMLTTMA